MIKFIYVNIVFASKLLNYVITMLYIYIGAVFEQFTLVDPVIIRIGICCKKKMVVYCMCVQGNTFRRNYIFFV